MVMARLSLEEGGSRSARGDLEFEVCAVDVRDRRLKDDVLREDNVVLTNEAESAAYHPEAVALNSFIVVEAPVVTKVGPDFTPKAVWDARLVGEGKTEGAVLRDASISRCPVQLEAILLVLSTSRATNHCRCQVDFYELSLRQVVHAIKLEANVILADLDRGKGDHLVVLVCHNELVTIGV